MDERFPGHNVEMVCVDATRLGIKTVACKFKEEEDSRGAGDLGTPKTIITMRDSKECKINQSKYCKSSLEKTIVIDNHIQTL